jgi:hypothetical protein
MCAYDNERGTISTLSSVTCFCFDAKLLPTHYPTICTYILNIIFKYDKIWKPTESRPFSKTSLFQTEGGTKPASKML